MYTAYKVISVQLRACILNVILFVDKHVKYNTLRQETCTNGNQNEIKKYNIRYIEI